MSVWNPSVQTVQMVWNEPGSNPANIGNCKNQNAWKYTVPVPCQLTRFFFCCQMNTRGDCNQPLLLPGTRSWRLSALLRGASEKFGEYEKRFGPVLHSCSNLAFQTLEPPGISIVNTKVSFHCGCTRCVCLMSPTVRAFLTRLADRQCHLVVMKGSAIQETCHVKRNIY